MMPNRGKDIILMSNTELGNSYLVTMRTRVRIPTYLWLVPPPFRSFYELYWIGVAILTFIGGYLWIDYYNDHHYDISQICLSFSFVLVPLVFIWLHGRLLPIFDDLSIYLWKNPKEYESWVSYAMDNAFTLASLKSKIVACGITLLSLITILSMPFPFNTAVLNIVGVAGFLVVVFLYSQAAFVLISLLNCLGELAARESSFEFYLSPHPSISALFRIYIQCALFVVFAYCVVIITIYFEPYGVNSYMQGWLTFLAIFPIAMFVWTLFRVHKMLKNSKERHVRHISSKISECVRYLNKPSPDGNAAHLEKLMSIQDKVTAMSEWPIGVQSFTSFLAVSAPLAVQLIASYLRYIK